MKATKQSFSIPAEMNEWLEAEMKRTRRGRSSLIHEGLELLREKVGESHLAESSSEIRKVIIELKGRVEEGKGNQVQPATGPKNAPTTLPKEMRKKKAS